MAKIITETDHLRSIAAQIYREGRKTDADAILGRVQNIEAEIRLSNDMIDGARKAASRMMVEIEALKNCETHLKTISLRLERWKKTGIESGRVGKDCNFDQLVELVKTSLFKVEESRKFKAVQS